ncbi:FabD/lysophospholipase-like protein [Polyplosphaeria fusca]|uniref:FabD/lysophospholipase-like protein n=1 Tax=Polyplosphaeria fusca TaxID=682080 RepID=A0A9P4V257_9PLEO|nr:FabD/lysophospholipase-like protein [Polyplosphaeria fusca]
MEPSPGDDVSCEDPRCRRSTLTTWYCVDCACSLCDECWNFHLPHTGGRTGRDGLPHERTQYHMFKRLDQILNPDMTLDTVEQLHNSDMDMTWFGIVKDSNGKPSFIDYDVYSTLMGHAPSAAGRQNPQIVSFIGQTNAGKSTLIKMLIDLTQQTHTGKFPSPVVGSPLYDRMPTSADVHLYADPETYNSSTPLLYADCEGLDAGEELPIGAMERRSNALDAERSMARLTPGRTRRLEWADTEETQTREYVVGALYPRILYTFSDVVVFVLRNAKTFQSTALRRLLEWGAASLEKSVNQPALPHAIIALNATDVGVATDQWDVRTATDSLLDANKDSLDRINGVPYFRQLAEQWRAKGRTIDSIADLINCYYSTFKVVRIPIKGRYQLLHDQVVRLRDAITNSREMSFRTKRQSNMLSSADELHVYLQSAFSHFSRTLEVPFNFVEVSLTSNPIPDDFGGHILQLALAAQLRCTRPGRYIFDKLEYPIASCVMLDCVRYRKGQPEDLFDEYEDSLHYALEQFCNRYIPCEFKTDTDTCINVASAHEKGHQNRKGKILSSGPFTSSFNAEDYYPIWREAIQIAIHQINENLIEQLVRASKDFSEEEQVLKLHTRLMKRFYDDIFFDQRGRGCHAVLVKSHSVCFCCLMQPPQHTLPCGHVLCTPCIKSYGKQQNENKFIFQLDHCPLHRLVSQWQKPHLIRFKPDHAGTRLLCLDGGGMRGIVELEVLRSIQAQFNNKIPIRAFFDLIVGTSTGGIISLAFGVKNWDLDDCVRRFEQVCSKAFSPREFSGMPILKYFVTMKHAAKYKTKPLRNVLEEAFGKDLLFGNSSEETIESGAKVAVTATDAAGKRAIVLANYSREHGSRMEANISATSAAPSFFKPFNHHATQKTYLDGALYHNNPVKLIERERKLLWPDVANKHPDVLVSIGTSQNENQILFDLPSDSLDSEERSRYVCLLLLTRVSYGHRSLNFARFSGSWFHNRFDSILDAEITWRDFVADVDTQNAATFRYLRINPDIGRDPPKLDDVGQLKRLQEDTQKALKTPDSKVLIERTAHTLAASSFYYEKLVSPWKERDGSFSCRGRLCCRFENGSDHVRSLGEYMRAQQNGEFQPFFEIRNDEHPAVTENVVLSAEDVNAMVDRASFSITLPDIRTRKQSTHIHIEMVLRGQYLRESKVPISGFPRTLMVERSLQSKWRLSASSALMLMM